MTESAPKLFQMNPVGKNQAGNVVSTWIAEVPLEPRDEFDRRDANYPQTTGQIALEVAGVSPHRAASIQNANAAKLLVQRSVDVSKEKRVIDEETARQASPTSIERLREVIRDSY